VEVRVPACRTLTPGDQAMPIGAQDVAATGTSRQPSQPETNAQPARPPAPSARPQSPPVPAAPELGVGSPTHLVFARPDGNGGIVIKTAPGISPDRDFGLILDRSPVPSEGLSYVARDEAEEGWARLALFRPANPEAVSCLSLRVLLDASASMRGPGIGFAKRFLTALLGLMGPGDTLAPFALSGGNACRMTKALTASRPEDRLELARALSGLSPSGPKDLAAALRGLAVQDPFRDPDRRPMSRARKHRETGCQLPAAPRPAPRILVISDGLSAGLARAVEEASGIPYGVFCLTVGLSPHHALMARLAQAGGGSSWSAAPGEDPESLARAVLKWLRARRFASVSADWRHAAKRQPGSGKSLRVAGARSGTAKGNPGEAGGLPLTGEPGGLGRPECPEASKGSPSSSAATAVSDALWESPVPRVVADGEPAAAWGLFRGFPDSPCRFSWTLGGTRTCSAQSPPPVPSPDPRLPRLLALMRCRVLGPGPETQAIALLHGILTPDTGLFLVHRRPEGEKAQGIPVLQQIPQASPPDEPIPLPGSPDEAAPSGPDSAPVSPAPDEAVRHGARKPRGKPSDKPEAR
jgi:hypothetical protein